jgi:hypothetical protein
VIQGTGVLGRESLDGILRRNPRCGDWKQE